MVKEYFPQIGKIKFEGKDSNNPLAYHYYDAEKYKDLPKARLYDQMITDSFGCYKGYAGVMQQYIFNYERNVIHGK